MVTKMKMPKINFQKLFDNNKLIIVLSFIIAITALFVVKTVVSPEGNVKISNVPITINLDGSTAATSGLKVISKEVDTVTAVISGKIGWYHDQPRPFGRGFFRRSRYTRRKRKCRTE